MEKSKIRKEYQLNAPPCRRVMCGGRMKGNAGHWDEWKFLDKDAERECIEMYSSSVLERFDMSFIFWDVF